MASAMASLSAKDKDVSASSLEFNASVPNSTKPCSRAKHEGLREAQSWISFGLQPN